MSPCDNRSLPESAKVRVKAAHSPIYCVRVEAYGGIDYLLIGKGGDYKLYKEQAGGCLQPMEIDRVLLSTLGTYFVSAGDEVPPAPGQLLDLGGYAEQLIEEMIEELVAGEEMEEG